MTVGTIYNLDENVSGSFNAITDPNLTQVLPGGVYIINTNSVTMQNVCHFIMRPTLSHSFDNWQINLKAEVDSTDYEFELGLFAQQRFNPVSRLLNIKKGVKSTEVQLYNWPGNNIIFQKTIPVIFTGDLEVKITYSNYTWKMAFINQGQTWTMAYKFARMTQSGNVTSRFLLSNAIGNLTVKKMEVKVNSPKNATVFIGDSITWGFGLSYSSSGTFAEQYALANGNTTMFASGSLSSLDIVNSLNSIALLEPSKVFILVGDNDLYGDIPYFSSNIQAIYNSLSTLPVVPQIYFLNMTPETIDEGYWDLNQYLNSQSGTLNIVNVWDQLCRVDNPKLIQSQYVTDHVHLNQLGHDVVYLSISSL